MHIEEFSYYYQATGEEGGLFSIDFHFLPYDAGAIKDPYQMKLVARENYESLRGTVDHMLLENPDFDCERAPLFIDSPGQSRGGYRYKGKLRAGNSMFNILPSVDAEVEFKLRKTGDQEISINASFKLTHSGNIKALQTVLALPDISIGSEAQQQINELQNLLQTTGDTDSKILNLLQPSHESSNSH